jgi:hypothetical protein
MKVGCDGVNWTDFCEDSDEPSGSITEFCYQLSNCQGRHCTVELVVPYTILTLLVNV